MNSATAFIMGDLNRGKEPKVFDWEKAARLILEHKAIEASAGLQGDWEWTGGPIFRDGSPVPKDNTYTYLASTWATPELNLDGVLIDCYRMASETPGWGASTYWPLEALAILENGTPT